MNTMVISIMLFTCLLLLALIALAKPLKAIAKFLFSAAVGGCLLWAGQTLGAAGAANPVIFIKSFLTNFTYIIFT